MSDFSSSLQHPFLKFWIMKKDILENKVTFSWGRNFLFILGFTNVGETTLEASFSWASFSAFVVFKKGMSHHERLLFRLARYKHYLLTSRREYFCSFPGLEVMYSANFKENRRIHASWACLRECFPPFSVFAPCVGDVYTESAAIEHSSHLILSLLWGDVLALSNLMWTICPLGTQLTISKLLLAWHDAKLLDNW